MDLGLTIQGVSLDLAEPCDVDDMALLETLVAEDDREVCARRVADWKTGRARRADILWERVSEGKDVQLRGHLKPRVRPATMTSSIYTFYVFYTSSPSFDKKDSPIAIRNGGTFSNSVPINPSFTV